MSIELYQGLELSIERALSIIPAQYREEYRQAYSWIMADAGTLGPRPYGKNAPKGIALKLAAERGIHKPGGRPYVLTVSSSGNDVYAADHIHHLDDGTWMLQYCAHRRNAGKVAGSPQYNVSLRACLRDGIPVGVFVKEGTDWLHMGLAFIERYDTSSEFFWLHGPVTEWRSDRLSPVSFEEYRHLAVEFDGSAGSAPSIDPLLPDERDERDRVLATVVRRKQQGLFRSRLIEAYEGRCAISRYDAEPALEAAHISSYLGKRSQMASNGLLLRSDLHALYDCSWLSVDPGTMRVCLAPQLLSTRYAQYDNQPIALPRDRSLRPSEERLAMKHSDFLLANSAV